MQDGRPSEIHDDRFLALLSADAEVVRLATGGIWSEGPAYLRRERAVVWSDIPNDRILRWSSEGGLSVHLQPCGFTNGRTLDLDGRIIQCEHGNRRVTRLEPDGRQSVLADRFEGNRLNSPNDVIVKSDGTVWFTDPPYGIVSDREGHKADSELGVNYVFRFDPASGELGIVTDYLDEPNGLAFSPDEQLLYVTDTSAALREDGNHHIVVFDVVDGEALARPRIFAVIEPGLADGLRVDIGGNVFTSSAEGIQVYADDGTHLGTIHIPEVTSNCAFGGDDGRRLFVTASSSLYAIDTLTTGATVRP